MRASTKANGCELVAALARGAAPAPPSASSWHGSR